jgi:hypothetical protein
VILNQERTPPTLLADDREIKNRAPDAVNIAILRGARSRGVAASPPSERRRRPGTGERIRGDCGERLATGRGMRWSQSGSSAQAQSLPEAHRTGLKGRPRAVRGYFCRFQALHDTTLDSPFAWL